MSESTDIFEPEVVAAVMRHMNNDHADDCVLICRAQGGQPDTTAARMSGMDADAIEFAATVGNAEVAVRVPWNEPIRERAQVRAEVAQMYHDACAQLGVTARVAGEH